MKIAIIVFSPSGNTRKAANLIKESFFERKAQVKLIDVTCRKEMANQESIAEYLNEMVEPHDILCIGGLVYAGHLQENVKNIINALPLPDNKWGSLVVPFVTYGGVHSSVALKEAGVFLRKRKRTNISGVKIAASHSLTKKFPFKINDNKPSKLEFQVIETLTERVWKTYMENTNELNDVSSSFSYIGFAENLLYKIFSEKMLHKIMFGKIKFDYNKCVGCGICVKKCPIQIIEMKNKKAERLKNVSAECSYCSECYHNCKFDAISFNLSKSKRYLSHINNKGKFESPQSAVYPLNSI